MKLRRPQRTDRPPIPEHLRRFDVIDWITRTEALVGATTEADAARLAVKIRRRWLIARQGWAAQNGYSAHEMYLASTDSTSNERNDLT